MADIVEIKNASIPTDGDQSFRHHWQVNVNDAGNYNLNTQDTYLDRDIDIYVPKGSAQLKTTMVQSQKSGAITPSVFLTSASLKMPTLVSTAPTTGEFYTLSTDISVPADAHVTTIVNSSIMGFGKDGSTFVEGYVKQGDVIIDASAGKSEHFDVGVGLNNPNLATYYLPFSRIANSDFSIGNLDDDDKQDKGVRIVDWTSQIKKVTVSDEDTKTYDSIDITLALPTGFYVNDAANGQITLSIDNVLPDFDKTTRGYNQHLLEGHFLYDDNGHLIQGMMPARQYSNLTYTSNTTDSSNNVSYSGDNVTLTTDAGSGVRVTGTGNAVFTVRVPGGYYPDGTTNSIYSIKTNATDTYINAITVAADKQFGTITNNGTISTITNNKTISAFTGTTGSVITKMSGVNTIGALGSKSTDSLVIKGVNLDNSSNASNTAYGSIVLETGNKTIKIVDGGKLRLATIDTQQFSQNNPTITPIGWFNGDTSFTIPDAVYTVEAPTNNNTQVTATLTATGNAVYLETGKAQTAGYLELVVDGTVTDNGTVTMKTEITKSGFLATNAVKSKTVNTNATVTSTKYYIKEVTKNVSLDTVTNDVLTAHQTYDIQFGAGYLKDAYSKTIDVYQGKYTLTKKSS